MHFPAFEERHAAHIRPEMLALSKREAPVTLAEWKALRMNSYESHIIAPRLDDEAFAYYAAEVLRNSLPWDNSTPFITYNDALIGFVAPEMLRRWRATSAPVPLPLTNDDAPYTDAEIADLVLWANEVDSGWTAESMRAALAWQRYTARAALRLARRAEARGRASTNVLYAPPEAALRRSPLAAALVQAGASAQYAANQFEMALSDAQEALVRHMERSAVPMSIAIEPSERTRVALLAGGTLALSALLNDGPEAAQAAIDAQRAAAPTDALPITRAEATLVREAIYHLPGFAGEEQTELLAKLRAFLDGVKS